MSRNAIIFHGRPTEAEFHENGGPTNFAWLPWIRDQLTAYGIPAELPEMPVPYDPDYRAWEATADRMQIGPETDVVGHSLGAGFLLRYFSEHPDKRVGRMALVAPSLGKRWDAEARKKFFDDFTLDPELAQRTGGLVIFHSDGDHQGADETIELIRTQVPGIVFRKLDNHGHFIPGDMPGNGLQFPELLEELTGQR